MDFTFVENIEQEEFDRFAVEGNVDGHFLRSYAWGQVSANRGWKPYYVGVRQGQTLVATALLLKKELLLGYSYFYIPRGFTMDYTNQALLEFLTASLKKFCKKHRAIHFKIDPDIKLHTIDLAGNVVEGEQNYALVERLQALGYQRKPLNYFFEREQPRFTFRIPMNGSVEEMEARFHADAKRHIKRAEIPSMKVVIGDSSNIKDFVRVMGMTEKRKNFYSHSEEYYQRFYDIFAENKMVTLYMCILDIPQMKQQLVDGAAELEARIETMTTKRTQGKRKELELQCEAMRAQLAQLEDKPNEQVLVSSHLIVHYAGRTWALYAGNDMHYSRFSGNYKVYNRILRDAVEAGNTMFDQFGSVGKPEEAGQLKSIYDFKKLWGGEFTEFIGEFDHVENPLMYKLYTQLIPYYHRMVKRQLRKRAQEHAE